MKLNFTPIYQRELRSLFYSPIAALVLAFFLLVAGYFWSNFVAMYSNYSMRVLSSGGRMGPTALKLTEYMLAPYLGNLTVTFLFFLPLLSMRSFSEEKKSGTIEMLFTYPFSDLDILLGKYLASLTLLAVMVGMAGLLPLTVADLASLPWPSLLLGYAGLFLIGAAFLALGTLTSTFTENQVVAAVLGFSALLLLFILDWVAQSGGPFSDFFNELSAMSHFKDSLAKGLVNLKDVSYFILFIAFCLFATLRVLESKKWR
jgi:ABC-2 type transport system permease protein